MTSVAVHHVITGRDDAPVVVLHGSLGSTLAMWEPQVGPLAERFRVVRYDLRGHGRSPAPPGPYTLADLAADATALLDHLGVDRAHHVGLSLGGMVTMQLAATSPARVDRLVLCCTAAHLPPARRWHDRAAAVREEGIGAVAAAVVERWLTAGLAADDPDLVGRLLAMVLETSDEGYAGCCEAVATMDLRDDLASITAPTLLVVGDEDPATPREHAEVIAGGAADARVVTVGPAAHLANVEQPDAVTSRIIAHLDGGRQP
jgi:3-oxoadipate enol-lactonase